MTTKKLIELGKSLGLDYYNECDDYVCFRGENGQSSIFYSSSKDNEPATMIDFAKHLRQMGRDSIKMELHDILNIMTHK